jgi:hypothetical protein
MLDLWKPSRELLLCGLFDILGIRVIPPVKYLTNTLLSTFIRHVYCFETLFVQRSLSKYVYVLHVGATLRVCLPRIFGNDSDKLSSP